jgi:hypothetical protein
VQVIPNARIGSDLDFRYGEGWATFSWVDENRIDRALMIDMDGHCSREMPIRSGTGVTILAVQRDRIRLQFTDELAAKLELDQVVEFLGTISEESYNDLRRLVEYL